MLEFEENHKKYTHKGMPLVWISDGFRHLGYPVHAKRYFMYTLCEDAAAYGGAKRVDGSGVYFRAIGYFQLSEQLVEEYTKKAYTAFKRLGRDGWFPERTLAELDHRWMTSYPSELEYGQYWSNRLYIEHLLRRLGRPSDKGRSLERIAHYLLSMIPGCRAYLRKPTGSSDLDVVGSFQGPSLDFRAEFSRYFVCECKDWNTKADFTTIAKLARTLDSVKSRFGIILSKDGISGAGRGRFAEREQLKVFAANGIAIVVITLEHLKRVANGECFLEILRGEYEMVRLDVGSGSTHPIP
jgi:hypothetical protein